jgi:hypothetical protein
MSVTLEQDSRPARPSATLAAAKAAGRDPSTWAPNEHINRRSSIPFILLHFRTAATGSGAFRSSCSRSSA